MNSTIKTLLMVENVHQSEFFEKILNQKFILNKTNDFYGTLELLDTEHFDILLLNLDIKDQENTNFLKKLRAQHPDVPFLIISNHYNEEIPLKAFELGAHDYLVRGEFTSKILERSIFNAIKKKDLELKLRKEAERIIEDNGIIRDITPGSEAPKNLTEALHELQVNRIELEMQNEELRKTWSELEESRQKFQDLYDFAPVGYLSMDEKGLIIEANLTVAGLLDIERKNLIGKAFILFMDYDSRRKFHKHLSRILDKGTRGICQLKIKNQGEEEVSFDAQLESIPLYDEEGNLKMLRTILTDITERKNAELSVARLAALVKSSDDAIIGADLGGKIQSWNLGAQKIYGYSAEEMLDKDVDKLIPPHCLDAETVILNSVEKSEVTKNYNTKRSTKNKGEIDVSLTLSPILDGDGKIMGTSSISRDITHVKDTERELEKYRKNLEKQVENRTKQLEIANKRLKNVISEQEETGKRLENLVIELKRSNKELEQFAYVASHDLQEPLRMVSSFTQLLERQYNDKLDENAHEYIKFAVDGAKRMQTLINDLLAYSRVTSRGEEFNLIDMEKVVKQALLNLEITIEENGAVIEIESLPSIYADQFQMVQLFQNLIGNAIKYRSKEPPVIHISAEKRDDEFIFKVSDNGIGIPQEYNKRIFKIFQRLHESHVYTGTGVGLAICKKIVERHSGRMWVDSIVGEGSTFYFSIPEANS